MLKLQTPIARTRPSASSRSTALVCRDGALPLVGHWLVQQVQVDVVEAELAEAHVVGAERRVIAVVADPQLGLHEQPAALDAAIADASSRPRARSDMTRRCRSSGSRCQAPPRPRPTVSAGGLWKTPSPRAGSVMPLFSVMTGMSYERAVMGAFRFEFGRERRRVRQSEFA